MLKKNFQILCQTFTQDKKYITTLWKAIEKKHSEPTRYYHTLKHLEQFYKELQEIDPITEFAIFYHDLVYDASRNDNEEQSALLCEKQLMLLNVPSEIINEVSQLILETKTHTASSQRNATFLDADLAILGANRESYTHYMHNVRQEYSLYNDMNYKYGRKKVLEMFLEKERIYISEYFYKRYEQKARSNIAYELATLSL